MGPGPNATQTRVNEEPRQRRSLTSGGSRRPEEKPAPPPAADPHEAAAAFVRVAHGSAPDFGFPEEAFLDALLAAPVGAPPAEAVVAALASRERAERSLRALALLPCVPAAYVADAELSGAGIALARGLATDCLANGCPAEHRFWELAFVFAFERSLRSGALLRRLVGEAPAVDGLGTLLTGALAREPLAGAIADLNVDPAALAERHAALAAGAPLLLLPFAATLHLRRVNAFLRRVVAEELLEVGVPNEIVRGLRALVDEALERDLTSDVLAELHEDAFACVEEAAAWGGDVHDAVACWAGLAAVPARIDPALRRIYLCSLGPASAEFGSDVEGALIAALGEHAEDRFALEQLAQHLSLRGDRTRARRVVRYLATLRQEPDRFQPVAC